MEEGCLRLIITIYQDEDGAFIGMPIDTGLCKSRVVRG